MGLITRSHGGEFCEFGKIALYGFEGAEEALSKRHKDEKPAHGGIAQLVEHLLCKQGVIGSNPFTSTILKDGVKESRSMRGMRAHSSVG